MGKREYCSHCHRLIINDVSESGPATIRIDGEIYCNSKCLTKTSEKLKPNRTALGMIVGFLGGSKVDDVFRNTIDRVNKRKGF